MGIFHSVQSSLETFISVKENVIPGSDVMIGPGNTCIFLCAAASKNSKKNKQEWFIYRGPPSQDNTNVLNSNEKIPAQLCWDAWDPGRIRVSDRLIDGNELL
jgi:hypothetical protein